MSRRRKFTLDLRSWSVKLVDIQYEYGNVLLAYRHGAIRKTLALSGEKLAEIIAGLKHKSRVMRTQADTLDRRLSGDGK